jgi:serine/threonine protein kinase
LLKAEAISLPGFGYVESLRQAFRPQDCHGWTTGAGLRVDKQKLRPEAVCSTITGVPRERAAARTPPNSTATWRLPGYAEFFPGSDQNIMASSVPAQIGKYDVIDIIGRGGMGVVYKAIDPHLDRPVAIKMITTGFAENPAQLKRFFVEAKSLASLVHPNIVTVYDLGDFGGNPYLVMQFLEGEDLDSVLAARWPLTLLDKTNIIIQVCEGLSYAHQRNVVHRDIKAANIMLAKDGSIKIFDFGIAKMGDQNVTKSASQIVGTLYYMSPEQVNGQPVDGRTDIFSTGVVLYQLVTNHLPFEGESTTATLLKITREPPPPLKNFLTVYPPELEAIVLRALAKDREERYQSADELALDLRQMQGHLKQELIDRNMEEVALLMERTDLYKAKDRLMQVLKIDQQNTRANQLLREVQGQIQRQELNAQVGKLREKAEEAFAHGQYPMAQDCLDRALSLDRNNTRLQRLRDQVRLAAERAEKLQAALRAAEAAHADGRLDVAKEAVESALEMAPDDTQAKALYRLIHRDWVELSRQRQMESYLAEARQEISARRFTAALEILKEAETLDPKAPQVHALLEAASAGQMQERRRKELETLIREVEDALNRDDYRAACAKSSEGLSRFPGERTLLKLQVLAEKQKQVDERKQFVDDRLAVARTMLQEKRNEELLKSLEGTLAEIGPEPRLQSLLSIVRENVERERLERRRAECLQKASGFLHNQDFDNALHTLESAAQDLADDAEIREFMQKIRAERAELVQGTIRRAQQESSLDLRYRILEEALTKNPQEAELQEQLDGVQRLGKVIASIAQEARSLEQAHHYDQALVKWETLRSTYRHYPDLERILDRIKKLRDEAQEETRAGWLGKIENAMNASDYVTASALVSQAEQEFPWDGDLMEFKQNVAEALKLRAKAHRGLADGQKLFANQQWEDGAKTIIETCRAASQDRMIQERGASELLQACKTASEKNWRAAEILLQQLAQLKPPLPAPPELEARIREVKKEESLHEAIGNAKKMQSVGELQGAVGVLAQALTSYPEEPRLLAMQRTLEEQIRQVQEKDRLERVRQEKEAYILGAVQSAQQQPALDVRIRILEEALRKEPREARLLRPLNEARDLAEAVSSLANQARTLELDQKYDQALAKWEALRTTYPAYPDLDRLIEGTRERRRKAALEAKGKLVEELQAALAAANYQHAEQLLPGAKREFPGDTDLAAIEKMMREGIERRAEAQKLLTLAMKAVGKSQWQKAAESFQAAQERASADPVVLDQVLRGLVQASEASLKSDLDAADSFLASALQVQPGSPLLAPLKGRVQDHKRERFLKECLNAAERARTAGDTAGGLSELDRGLSMYPDEPKLLESRKDIEIQMHRLEEEQQRVRERGSDRRAQTQPIPAPPRMRSELEEPKQGEPPQTPSLPVAAADEMATQLFDPLASAIPADLATEPVAAKPGYAVLPPHPSQAEPPMILTASASELADTSPRAGGQNFPPSYTQTLTSMLGDLSAERAAELRTIEKDLAVYLGPLARIVVKRAAAKTTDPEELCKIVAQSLEKEQDRDAFLARQSHLSRRRPKPQGSHETTKVGPLTEAVNPLTPLGITAEAIDHAARALAEHVGPISSVLAKKAARRADSLQTFYRLLAEHVQNGADRRRFLRDAGFPDK